MLSEPPNAYSKKFAKNVESVCELQRRFMKRLYRHTKKIVEEIFFQH